MVGSGDRMNVRRFIDFLPLAAIGTGLLYLATDPLQHRCFMWWWTGDDLTYQIPEYDNLGTCMLDAVYRRSSFPGESRD